MTKERLVVVGNGMAGARLVEEVLARGGRDKFDITMFGDEPYGNYNRILLSTVLAGDHDTTDIFLNPLDWYGQNGVTLHAGVKAVAMDRTLKQVFGTGKVLEQYDKLVFATGSTPFVPPMAGLEGADGAYKPGVFVFRTIEDCDRMREYAGHCRSAAVIGGGLLGLEAARGLKNLGVDVHVVHLLGYLMDAQMDAASGGMLTETMRGMGVTVHLEKSTSAILGDEAVCGLQFNDGSVLDCDMVVVAAGIRPNTALAKAGGLNVERGIVVHDNMSCRNDENVFAIGECAQHRGVVYGLVAPAWEQARVLADVLTGANPRSRYEGSKLSTKLKVMGVELAVMGAKEPQDGDEVVSYVEPRRGVYKKLIIREGRLAGAILLGDGAAAPRLLQAFDRNEALPDVRADLLFGGLTSASPAAGVEEMPDDAQICNCNGVSKGKIVAAIGGGARTLQAVCSATRAGTGCGTCKVQVKALLDACAGPLVAEDPSATYYVPGVPYAKPELIAAIRKHGLRSVSAVFAELAAGAEDPGSKAGLASLLKTIWTDEYEDERDARFVNDRVHANIQKDGTFSVVPRIYGGITTPAELKRIAETAERHQVRMVKFTGGQRIDLLGIPKEELPMVWQELGMPSGHAYTKAFRTCKTCVGTEFCRYGVGDSVKLGIAIEKRFQGIESPHKMKLATTGCPRNCSEATTKDLGAVAIEGGRWEVYVGGAAGSRVRKGDVLVVVDSHEDVLKYMGRFMEYYRQNAKYLERTYDYVDRTGIDRLRQVLVDDSEGICAELDAAIQRAVDAYQDPWQEAVQPYEANQFQRTLEPVAVGVPAAEALA